ncbi:hypothetical protein ABZP36_032639 [Zizania latifolia]
MPSSSHSPPSPAPATSATASTYRRRRRLLPSLGSPSFSSSFPPASPSPFHRFLPSPFRASSVPFSWEHRPGIPKTPAWSRSSSSKQAGDKPARPLPLPPSLLSGGAVVPAEYAGSMQRQGDRRLGKARPRRRPRPRPRLADALAEWLSVLSLYRSCKRAAACFAAKPPSPAAA